MSQAAHQHGVSPSAMSESVKILENHCGQALLERRHDGVTPTEYGLKVYHSAKKMTDAAKDALRKIDTKKRFENTKISLPGELASFWFKDVWQEFYQHGQTGAISLLCEDIVLDHERFTRDLFIRVSHSNLSSNLNVLFEHTINVVYVAHPQLVGQRDVNRIDDILDLPLICKPQKDGKATVKLPAKDPSKKFLKFTFNKGLFVDEIQTRIALSKSGLGIVGCLEPSVQIDIKRNQLTLLAPNELTLQVSFIIATPHSQPAEATIQLANLLSQWVIDNT